MPYRLESVPAGTRAYVPFGLARRDGRRSTPVSYIGHAHASRSTRTLQKRARRLGNINRLQFGGATKVIARSVAVCAGAVERRLCVVAWKLPRASEALVYDRKT
ncbi:hypothetical protein EVAR_37234_1 [Eumeta japonica]|uniref:Uncharacterized protein n=1 Tax=Eumeta variegata TaxID=151549 RepID=A0A4C1Y965_EUMVA|nr:hypothetical protein EVAR_37234_1 [Eumeta japonica]